MTMPGVLKHLRVLEDAGLITAVKDGRVKQCRLDPEPLRGRERLAHAHIRVLEHAARALARYLETREPSRITSEEKSPWPHPRLVAPGYPPPRLYRKPRTEVFKAWTDPKELKRWWGPPGYDAPSTEVDLRVGGRYRFTMRKVPDGQPYIVTGVYQEIVPVSGWSSPGTGRSGPPFGSNTLVTVEFRDVAGGTEIVLIHEHFESERLATNILRDGTGVREVSRQLFSSLIHRRTVWPHRRW